MTPTAELGQIEAMRAFNRFYTDRIGLLDRAYLDADYTLTEARVIYELGARGETTASALTHDLHLDAAYLSRILKRYRTAGLIDLTPDPADRRSRTIRLTAGGHLEYERLGDLSRNQLARMLSKVSAGERETLVAAFATIRRLLDPDAVNGMPAIDSPPPAGRHGLDCPVADNILYPRTWMERSVRGPRGRCRRQVPCQFRQCP